MEENKDIQQEIKENVENSENQISEEIKSTGITEENPEESPEKTPEYSFGYNLTIAESEFGIKRFYRKYFIKTAITFTVVFSIFALLFVKPIITDYTNIFAWAMFGVCVALIIEIWLRPRLNRKKIISVIETMKNDKYICDVYDDFLETRVIIPEEEIENGERVENP